MSNSFRHVRVLTTFLAAGASIALFAGSAAHGKKLIFPRVHVTPGSQDASGQGKAASTSDTAATAPDGAGNASGTASPTAAEGQSAATSSSQVATQPPKPAALAVPGVAARTATDNSPAATAKAIAASRAEAERVDRAGDEGIDDNRDVVKPVLAKHPDSNLVICVAGCGPEPQIVQVLPRPPEKTDSQVVPSSSAEDEPGAAPGGATSDGAIVCVAGCKGKRGEVIYKRGRVSWIDPGESETIRHGLREIAERLSAELRVIAAAEQSQALTTWSGMVRSVMSAGTSSRTLADASAIERLP